MTACDIQDKTANDIPGMTVHDISYRPATPADELHVVTMFSRMLRELEPLGHDVLPTDHNVDLFYEHLFLPAIVEGRHGIYLAVADDKCIGCSFFAPERTDIETPPGRAVAHGIWVHPDYRGQGVALELQQHAHRALSRAGFTKLISCVVADNVAGLASAKRGGAAVTGYMTNVNLACNNL